MWVQGDGFNRRGTVGPPPNVHADHRSIRVGAAGAMDAARRRRSGLYAGGGGGGGGGFVTQRNNSCTLNKDQLLRLSNLIPENPKETRNNAGE